MDGNSVLASIRRSHADCSFYGCNPPRTLPPTSTTDRFVASRDQRHASVCLAINGPALSAERILFVRATAAAASSAGGIKFEGGGIKLGGGGIKFEGGGIDSSAPSYSFPSYRYSYILNIPRTPRIHRVIPGEVAIVSLGVSYCHPI